MQQQLIQVPIKPGKPADKKKKLVKLEVQSVPNGKDWFVAVFGIEAIKQLVML